MNFDRIRHTFTAISAKLRDINGERINAKTKFYDDIRSPRTIIDQYLIATMPLPATATQTVNYPIAAHYLLHYQLLQSAPNE